MPNHAISHGEWNTTAPASLKDFLSGLFGWQFVPFGETCFITGPGALPVSVGINKNDQAVIGGGTSNVCLDVGSIDRVQGAQP